MGPPGAEPPAVGLRGPARQPAGHLGLDLLLVPGSSSGTSGAGLQTPGNWDLQQRILWNWLFRDQRDINKRDVLQWNIGQWHIKQWIFRKRIFVWFGAAPPAVDLPAVGSCPLEVGLLAADLRLVLVPAHPAVVRRVVGRPPADLRAVARQAVGRLAVDLRLVPVAALPAVDLPERDVLQRIFGQWHIKQWVVWQWVVWMQRVFVWFRYRDFQQWIFWQWDVLQRIFGQWHVEHGLVR